MGSLERLNEMGSLAYDGVSKIPGLYLHVPFCQSKCGYCDFYSVTDSALMDEWVEAVLAEMEMYRDRFEAFDTIYFGGGTPSLLPARQVERILNHAEKTFHLLSHAEITLEANPGDLDRSHLSLLKRIGVNRIVLGIQSFDEAILTFLGRRHRAREGRFAILHARETGFENVGLDLIYGIPGQDEASWRRTLEQALAFSPEHISCYELTLGAETPLGKRREAGAFELPEETLQYDFFMRTAQCLEGAGYVQYEVSNFAKEPRSFSRHNQKYWDHTPYLGLGPSAHSFLSGKRWWNHRSLSRYLRDVKKGKVPVEGSETLTIEELRLEALFLGLRTRRGVDLERFRREYGYDLMGERGELLMRLENDGLILIRDGLLVPTRAGMAVADRLALM